MSLSEEHFQRKKRQFWWKISAIAVAVVFIGAAVFFFLFISKAVVVEVAPDEAAPIAGRELSGLGFVVSDKIYLIGRKATLSVSAAGFVPQTVEINRSMAERNITVTLEEAQALLKATVSPPDDDIKWEMDGNLVGTGTKLVMNLEPGKYALAVSHPYYETQLAALDLQRGTEKTIEFTLEPVQGEIKISSEPQGVQVTLDRDAVGKTPLNFKRKGGVYLLEIKESGFDAISEQLEITADNPNLTRNYRLAYKKARVHLSLSPSGGELLLNGRLAPTTSPLEVEPLREITFAYTKPGYSSREVKKTFSPGQSAEISFSLPPEFGEVEIAAAPESEIFLAGKAAGSTPRTFNLRTVPQTVSLVKQGYRTITVKFTPEEKRVTRISRTLETELQARLSESPGRTKNSIGVELLLFDPRRAKMPFIMGAPRSEKGQRANEFLRTVRITKPFYVSSREISASQYSQFQNKASAGALPVANIAWEEAAGFCNWLSKKEKLASFYVVRGGRVVGFDSTADGYRLPSEAEWEWLARYANRPESAKFVWGNKTVIPGQAANLADESARAKVEIYIPGYNDGHAQAAPVGSLAPDAAGLYDMAGNVSEWVNDVYTLEIPAGALTNPLGPRAGTEHVVKGSSWRSGTLSSLRSSFREGLSGKRGDLGFRIARYIYGGNP